MDRQLINIILLGASFMTLFIAFQTTSLIAQSVLEGVKNETVNGTSFQGSGYTSQAILYSVFTVVNVIVPAIVARMGPSLSMFVGAIAYALYTISFIYPMTWSYYAVSILMGFGAAMIWTGQGVYLSVNSNEATLSRNSGIFWALLQSSLIPGNVYIYLALKTEIIDRNTRYSLFAILSVVSGVGLLLFLLIVFRSYMQRKRDTLIKPAEEEKSALADIVHTLKVAGRLLKTRHMLVLQVPFIYLGLCPVFIVNVYGTAIGHYKKYGEDRKRLLGLHGMLIGAGEIVGGGLFGFITKPRTGSQRALVVFISFVLQIIFYYGALMNIPSDAPGKETDLKPYMDFSQTTSEVLAFIGSFIVGLGDSGLNTQLMNILASRYKDTAASAFAIFKLVQSLGAAVASFYAGPVELQWQILILVVLLFIGTLSFFSVLFDEPPPTIEDSPNTKEIVNTDDLVSSSST